MHKRLWLSFLGTALLCSCVSVPNVKQCTVAGVLAAGMDCAETNTGVITEMTLDETMEFLQPTAERAGAICISAADRAREKNALEKACRLLGKRCTYEVKQAIQSMGAVEALSR